MRGRHGVEVLPPRMAKLPQLVVVVAASVHPPARGRAAHARGDGGDDVTDAGRGLEIDVEQREPERQHVAVRVVEAGNHGGAAEIVAARAGTGERLDLAGAADRDDLALRDGEALDAPVPRVEGEHVAAGEDGVGRETRGDYAFSNAKRFWRSMFRPSTRISFVGPSRRGEWTSPTL